jgi:hypothetical protein
MALVLTQPLIELSTRNLPGEERGLCLRLTTSPPSVSLLSRKCGILDVPQPYGPPWRVEIMLKEATQVYIEALSEHSPRGTEGNQENRH